MKKVLSLIIVSIILLCLTGCTPANVKDVHQKIEQIGEVTIDSIDQIQEANMLYGALNEEERQKVENFAILEEANSRLSEILFVEIKSLLNQAKLLESSFFAKYYDTQKLIEYKTEAKKIIKNSDVSKYESIYIKLNEEINTFNRFIEMEKANSISSETNDGKYPFAIDLTEIEYGFCLAPRFKLSSAYPVNPCFFDSETTDELPLLHFELKGSSGVYSFKLRQVETRWIEVKDENGKKHKAFVNTELVLSDPPDSWMPCNDIYSLGKKSCYLFNDKEKGFTLAIKDLISDNGYILYSF